MIDLLQRWTDDEGQDIAEYAVILAVILVLVVGTVRLIGSNSNSAFSAAASRRSLVTKANDLSEESSVCVFVVTSLA